ncbi:hypothetical protein RJ639_018039 [Escallonia herrerae]|uniref:Uncharacterized protein n=1 Tax=Escallonia herrerae TaxID=1293975 RepID=A0AA89AIV6_9ASTE|nr:hypothetical protein RJ639_018039 [Escallonia herrerae]
MAGLVRERWVQIEGGTVDSSWVMGRHAVKRKESETKVFTFSFSFDRYEDKLPPVDIFVCTADVTLEPPTMVISTVLSLMSFNYPTEKLSIYLSDDGGSKFMFYALLEASKFSKYWIPFCKRFKVEPRSPAAYFARDSLPEDTAFAQEQLAVKELYEKMKIRIDTAMNKGSISNEMKDQHKGFLQWNSKVTKQDHQSIVQFTLAKGGNAHIDFPSQIKHSYGKKGED